MNWHVCMPGSHLSDGRVGLRRLLQHKPQRRCERRLARRAAAAAAACGLGLRSQLAEVLRQEVRQRLAALQHRQLRRSVARARGQVKLLYPIIPFAQTNVTTPELYTRDYVTGMTSDIVCLLSCLFQVSTDASPARALSMQLTCMHSMSAVASSEAGTAPGRPAAASSAALHCSSILRASDRLAMCSGCCW